MPSRSSAFAPIVPFIVCAALIIATAVVAALVANPQLTVDWARYRDAARAGQIERAIWTLIPYSPADRNTDAYYVAQAAAKPGEQVQIITHPLPPSKAHWLGTERNGATRIGLPR